MKLVDSSDLFSVIELPDDLFWENEFKWVPVVRNITWGVSGSLIVQSNVKLAGRSIILKSPEQGVGWISRSTLNELLVWASDKSKVMIFKLEKPNDSRTFNVIFDENTPLEASPVKGWTDFVDDEWFLVTIKLLQVL